MPSLAPLAVSAVAVALADKTGGCEIFTDNDAGQPLPSSMETEYAPGDKLSIEDVFSPFDQV